ncbi:neprilysin-like [Cloeon dipterum]|uniref:neprilysin-like n=1 Tax=Cloeon dipterum TaxID=197152 RepID=UPI0032204A20
MGRYIVFLVLLGLMFAEASAISETYPQAKTIQGSNQAICTSDECIDSANRILTAMNPSVNPCDDFYEFACGGYMNKNYLPQTGSKSHAGDLIQLVDYRIKEIFNEGISPSMPETVKQAIDYYEKCTDDAARNTIGLEPMFKLLESIGLPRVPTQHNRQIRPWSEVLIRGDKMTGKTPFFNIEIEQKHGNTYLTWNVQKQHFNKQLFEEFFNTLNSHFRFEVIDAQEAARDLFSFYSSLFGMSDILQIWMTVDGLQQLTGFDWKQFLTSFLEDSIFKFDLEKDKILVRGPSYAKQLFDKLYLAQPEQIDFYTWFFYFYAMAPHTTTAFRDKYIEMEPLLKLPGPQQTVDLQMRCIAQARRVFPDAISYAYISKYFDEEIKQKTEVMVEDIYQAFKLLIKGLGWMDEQTKRFALEKLDAIKQNIGYPNWLMAPGALDLRDVRGDWLTMNMKVNIMFAKKYDVEKFIGKSWTGLSKISVNAFHVVQEVAIYVPAGIMHPPFTGNGLASLNYASLGAIIGHEMTHGFDTIGHAFDKNGEKNMWWSNETLKNFYERVQCMVDQYSQFQIPELGPNVKLDGAKTIGENIADNGGLREALLAYEILKYRQTHNGTHVFPDPEPYLLGLNGLSHKQLFFLGFANMWCVKESPDIISLKLNVDTHSPSRQRVLGTLANNKEFAEAWKCPLGSRMNPVKKCIVW